MPWQKTIGIHFGRIFFFFFGKHKIVYQLPFWCVRQYIDKSIRPFHGKIPLLAWKELEFYSNWNELLLISTNESTRFILCQVFVIYSSSFIVHGALSDTRTIPVITAIATNTNNTIFVCVCVWSISKGSYHSIMRRAVNGFQLIFVYTTMTTTLPVNCFETISVFLPPYIFCSFTFLQLWSLLLDAIHLLTIFHSMYFA